MKKRETKRVPSADLLVCFPPKAHLALLPKAICSPARPAESSKRHPNNHRNHHHHPLKKSTTRRHSLGGGIGGGGRGQAASPLLWAKNKQMAGIEIAEPTSPKVTCAGQIKVRHKAAACKSWQSVMEEIERIHNSRKNKKKSSWMDSFGFKKDVMQFLTCLRNIKFDFRCFGDIPQTDIITSDDEEEDDDDDEDDEFQEISNHGTNLVDQGSSSDHEDSRAFSKWFMVLQEDQNNELKNEGINDHDQSDEVPAVPPPNALLLMRCRSAPAKSWLEEKQLQDEMQKLECDHQEEQEEEGIKKEEKKGKNLKALMEEEKVNSNSSSNLVIINYDTDFYKISTDIAKETWVVGGMKDPLSRSRSWKR